MVQYTRSVLSVYARNDISIKTRQQQFRENIRMVLYFFAFIMVRHNMGTHEKETILLSCQDTNAINVVNNTTTGIDVFRE